MSSLSFSTGRPPTFWIGWLFIVSCTVGGLASLVLWLLSAGNSHLPKCPSPVGWGKDHPRFHWGLVASPAVSPQLPPFPLTSFEQNWTRYGSSHSAYPVAPFVTPICTPPSGHLVGSRLWSFSWYLLTVSIYWSLVPLYHSWTSNYIYVYSLKFSLHMFFAYSS